MTVGRLGDVTASGEAVEGRRSENGSMTLVVAVMVALGSMFALALGEAVVVAVESTRAQTAADAAALAAVEYGSAEAHAVAERNGARLTSIEIIGRTATVTVGYGRTVATARASADP